MEAATAAISDLRLSRRAMIVLATGLGKTMTAGYVADQFCGVSGRILFLVHNNGILRQAPKDFCRFFAQKHFSFVNGEEKDPSGRIVFATFQSLAKLLSAVPSDTFDLVVVDEGHHAEAEGWAPVVEHFDAPRLCLTATPDRMDGKDIRRLFGGESYSLALPQALARGLLPRVAYRFVTDSSFSKEELARIVREVKEEGRRDISVADLNRRLFVAPRDEEIVAILEQHPLQRAVFCRTIIHAERMAELLPFARAYHSGYSNTQNEETFNLFKERKLRYVTVVDAFNEGLSAPSVEGAAFLRTTESKRIYLQQLGRVLHSDLEEVNILDFAGSVERIKMGREFHDEIEVSAGKVTATNLKGEHVHVDDLAKFVFDEELTDLMDIVGRLEMPFYTYEEASVRAQEMGINTVTEYEARYHEDPRLPCSPHVVYSTKWTRWPVFLGKSQRINFYTYEEAQEKVRAMKIKTCYEYAARYKEDFQLPSNPNNQYKAFWKGWENFLGTEPYSYAEARVRAREMGVTTSIEYRRRYSEDPRLPSDPAQSYVSEWVDWATFLGRKTEEVNYYSYQEAKVRVREMGIRTTAEHKLRYKEDIRLWSNPNKAYSLEWESWPEFLGTKKRPIRKAGFYTYDEAKVRVREMGIRSQKEYQSRYQEDPRLPSTPFRTYSSSGWVDFGTFLGTK